MGNKINVAEILKNKPQGTKLYNLLYNIDIELDTIVTTGTKTIVWCTDKIDNNDVCHRFYSEFGTIEGYPEGLQILLPSKDMRDWGKFAWQKGDLLINSCGFQCIFKEWASDDYTKFNGCYSNSRDGYEDVSNAETAKFDKLDNNIAYGYVREIERKLGGILNLETLEIEKTQPEFKDGDIVFMKGIKSELFANCIFILKGEYKDGDERAFYYTFYNADDKFTVAEYGNTKVHYSLRSATDSEKQQLFDALAKEGKAWDAEKKQIIDLKQKVELKPFDKVLVRHQKTEEWSANIFSHTDKTDEYLDYICVNGRWEFCIPYIGNEHLLGTTKDVEG